MHVITQARLREFGKRYPDADTPLRVWERIMRSKRYENPHEVRKDFGGSVDFIGGNKTVFDIGGNKYRLVVMMMYKWGRVLIRHVLTHAEYEQKTKAGTL